MPVPVRNILFGALAAIALPAGAHAQCCAAGPGRVVVPAFKPPQGSVVGATPAPATGGGSACAGAGCHSVGVVVPGVRTPAPHITVTGHGPSVNVVTNHVTQGGVSISNTFVSGGFASASNRVFVVGGGGVSVEGGGLDGLAQTGALQLAAREERSSEMATRTVERLSVVRAVCMDDKGSPHPASQTFGGQDVTGEYRGELFRCMAGTAMQVTVGRIENGKFVFDGGETFGCAKGEALTTDGARLSCRVQEARRPCNERSLLRRHGAGVKVVRVLTTERYAVETTRRQSLTAGASMALDGGVGM